MITQILTLDQPLRQYTDVFLTSRNRAPLTRRAYGIDPSELLACLQECSPQNSSRPRKPRVWFPMTSLLRP